jgi:hypothetical protein
MGEQVGRIWRCFQAGVASGGRRGTSPMMLPSRASWSHGRTPLLDSIRGVFFHFFALTRIHGLDQPHPMAGDPGDRRI